MATNPTSPAPKMKQGTPAVPQTTLSQAMQVSMRKFLIISISLTVVITIAAGYFIWNLANQNIKVANEVKAQELYKTIAENKVNVLNDAEKRLVELKEKGDKQTSDFELATVRALPGANDLGSILTIFQKLETNNGVKIDSVTKGATATATASTPTASSGTKSMPLQITFKASGTYKQALSMLRELESSVRTFDFSSLKISGKSDDVSLDMTYQVYYLPAQSPTDRSVLLETYLSENKK